jgi:hypothetical protein
MPLAQVLSSRPSGRRRQGALAGEALPRGEIVVPMKTSGRDRISDPSATLLVEATGARSPDVLPGCA